MARRRSKQFWAEQIAVAEASGVSKADYCRIHGLDYRTFYRWFRRLEAEACASTQQALVPIAIGRAAPIAEPSQMRLSIGTGVSLSLPASTDARWLAVLLREVAAC
jgi:transposase-like protein